MVYVLTWVYLGGLKRVFKSKGKKGKKGGETQTREQAPQGKEMIGGNGSENVAVKDENAF